VASQLLSITINYGVADCTMELICNANGMILFSIYNRFKLSSNNIFWSKTKFTWL